MHIKQKKTQMMHNSQLSEIPLFLYTQKYHAPPPLIFDLNHPPTKTPHHYLMRGWRTKRAISPLATSVT